jgi:biopolymer transport protein TolQ
LRGLSTTIYIEFNMQFTSDIFSPIFADSQVMDYFFQSNFAGQVIVIILVIFSILAWGVMFCKKADLSAMEKSNKNTAERLRKSSLIEVANSKSIEGAYARILKDAVNAWLRSGVGNSPEDRTARIAHIENTIERSLSRQIMFYNTKMTLLGTVISGAPFLGLLGTAWGVMDCFGSMSAQASVTLQMLAPGVAGALLTTVAGLVVAIPSVFGYNFLTAKATELTIQTENFASLIADEIEMECRAMAKREESQPQQQAIPRATPTQQTSRPVMAQPEPLFQRPTPSEKIVNFTFDDDLDSPTLPRNFDD